MPVSSRSVFTALGLFLPVGAHLADYNATHIFNPRWTPHAKFHGGQTLMFSLMLGAATMLLAWWRTTDRRLLVLATSIVCASYWTSQGLAISYPGTAFFDVDTHAIRVFGVPIQLVLETLVLALTGLAAWLALRPSARWAA